MVWHLSDFLGVHCCSEGTSYHLSFCGILLFPNSHLVCYKLNGNLLQTKWEAQVFCFCFGFFLKKYNNNYKNIYTYYALHSSLAKMKIKFEVHDIVIYNEHIPELVQS